MINEGKAPLLIDCLSCEFGCNSGPLTATKRKPQDEIEYYVNKRSTELKEKYLKGNKNDKELSKAKIEETIEKYWKPNLYTRTYVNRWENVDLKYPSHKELVEIFRSMHKYLDQDIKNCSACGYGTCEKMATAIHNGLNRPENCHFYMEHENIVSHEETRLNKQKLSNILETAIDGFVETDNDEVIINANAAFKKMLKKSDIVGRKIFEFIDKKNLKTFLNQLKERKNKLNGSYELEFTQSDGNKIACLVSASVLKENGQKINSFHFDQVDRLRHCILCTGWNWKR